MSDERELLSDIPVESLPILQSNEDFIRKADRLRYLKQVKDEVFTDKKDAQGVPVGEWERLRLELGALVSVAGVASVVYQDLRISNTKATAAGAPGSGSVDGVALAGLLAQELIANDNSAVINPVIEQLIAIIAAARGFDEDALMEAGVAPHVIVRARGVGKGRAASVRVEWVGKKGRGAAGKQGAGGPVQ